MLATLFRGWAANSAAVDCRVLLADTLLSSWIFLFALLLKCSDLLFYFLFNSCRFFILLKSKLDSFLRYTLRMCVFSRWRVRFLHVLLMLFRRVAPLILTPRLPMRTIFPHVTDTVSVSVHEGSQFSHIFFMLILRFLQLPIMLIFHFNHLSLK